MFRVTNLRAGILMAPDAGLRLAGYQSADVEEITPGIQKALFLGHAKVENKTPHNTVENEPFPTAPQPSSDPPPVNTSPAADDFSPQKDASEMAKNVPPEDLTGIILKSALPMISVETDLEVLSRWGEKETRLVANKAIAQRIAELQRATN